MNFDKIPQDMKASRQWICHSKKIPKSPLYNGNASPTDPQTWGSFEQAVVALKLYGYDGLGFVFAADSSFCGIDIDHCIDSGTGELHPKAAEIVAEMSSYTELSPSGTGLHIIYRGNEHSEWKKKAKDALSSGVDLEMYQNERYFTVTGNPFGGPKAVEYRENEAAAIQKRFMQSITSKTENIQRQTNTQNPPNKKMDFDRAKEEIKARLPEYAEAVLTRSKGKTGKTQYICPFCGSGTGAKATGAFTVYPETSRYKCFSCGNSGDIFDLAAHTEGLEKGDLFKLLAERYGLQVDYQRPETGTDKEKYSISIGKDPTQDIHISDTQQAKTESKHNTTTDYTEFYREANKHLAETDYNRGITLETLNRFLVGYVPDWQPPKAPNAPKTPRLIIPRSRTSYLARDTRATKDIPEYQKQYTKQNSPGKISLFNIAALRTSTKPLYIVEGEIDAMSIIDVGGEAIATCSTSNIHSLLKALEEATAEQAAGMPLIIAFDDDEAGQKATAELVKGLQKLKKAYCVYRPHTGYKDANEALNADRKVFQSYVLHGMEHINELTAAEANREKKEYLEEITVAAHLQDFLDGVAASVNTEVISTGFPALDTVLDGGLYEGLYGIGAISSLGKTTFALQIADQIAAAGNDVLIFSLEMSRNELIAKSLSRLTAKITIDNHGDIRNAKTTRGIMTGKRYAGYNQTERQLINTAVQEYTEIAGDTLKPRISIIEAMGTVGADQVKEQVEKYIKHTGKKPVVIIDYLQILAPHNEKSTDKQNTDYAILNLKRLSRDHKIPVIVISSFNRENYSVKVAMQAFKESGAIEYSTDVLIGLQLKGTGESDFDVDEAKAKHPREIEAVILKNRNGVTGKKISYNYYTMFNYFSEGGIVVPDSEPEQKQRKRR